MEDVAFAVDHEDPGVASSASGLSLSDLEGGTQIISHGSPECWGEEGEMVAEAEGQEEVDSGTQPVVQSRSPPAAMSVPSAWTRRPRAATLRAAPRVLGAPPFRCRAG